MTGAVAAAVQPSAAVIQGIVNNKEVDMMVDSGSSISLIEKSVATGFSQKTTSVHHPLDWYQQQVIISPHKGPLPYFEVWDLCIPVTLLI